MFAAGWSVCVLLLSLQLSACDLEIYEHTNHEVICPQVLAGCSLKDVLPLGEEVPDAVEITKLTPSVRLCCNDSVALCTPCLVIDAEIDIDLDENLEDEDHSGNDDVAEILRASVTLCYKIPMLMPTCKKVEFTVNTTSFIQQNQTTVLTVIIQQLPFSGKVMVYHSKTNPSSIKEIEIPTLEKVCLENAKDRVKDCYVPGLSTVINNETNEVQLKFHERMKALPSVCVQYEKNGVCQNWTKQNISLYSVAPCMCFQAWYGDQSPMRSVRCPFRNNGVFKRNLLNNVSVSVTEAQTINNRKILLWNLSAPCRLEGEVWPCQNKDSCIEIQGFRQKLEKDNWRQNKQGFWEKQGVFEDIDLQRSPCLMVTIETHELGPFCFKNTDRWRWSLLIVGVLLLACLTSFFLYFFHVYIKQCVWSWNHGGFVKISRKAHVVLLSPPDADDSVSELVSGLGSHLCNCGFSVSVDQWSRGGQCTLGPLPWLHSQLLKPNCRVVLILTRKALEEAKEWTQENKKVIKTEIDNKSLPQIMSPYCDVFTTSLSIIEGEKQLGRVRPRFILVNFDLRPGGCKNLPVLLQGLPLFQLPSQTQAFLAELTVGGTDRESSQRTWKRWKWRFLDRWKVKTKAGPGQKKESSFKNIGAERRTETRPLHLV